jgi:ribose transport system permease protein
VPSDTGALSPRENPAEVPPEFEVPSHDVADDGRAGPSRKSLVRTLRPLLLGALRPAVPLITLCVIFTAVNSQFLTVSNLQGIVEQNVVITVAAVGATFVILMGAIDLSVEGVILTSSVVVALLVQNTATSANLGVIGILAGCLTGTVFGVVNGVLNTYARIPSFAVTLGTWYIGVGLQTVLQSHFARQGVVITDPGLTHLAINNKLGFSSLAFIALGVVVVGFLIQRFTMLGRRAYAVGGNETVARMSGIHVGLVKVGIFALAGTIYGLAGFISVTRYGGLGSGVSSGSILFAVITAVVVGGTSLAGGRGGVIYTVLGVLTLGVLNNGMILSGVPPFYQQIVQGGLIVFALGVGAWQTTRKTREIVK